MMEEIIQKYNLEKIETTMIGDITDAKLPNKLHIFDQRSLAMKKINNCYKKLQIKLSNPPLNFFLYKIVFDASKKYLHC